MLLRLAAVSILDVAWVWLGRIGPKDKETSLGTTFISYGWISVLLLLWVVDSCGVVVTWGEGVGVIG